MPHRRKVIDCYVTIRNDCDENKFLHVTWLKKLSIKSNQYQAQNSFFWGGEAKIWEGNGFGQDLHRMSRFCPQIFSEDQKRKGLRGVKTWFYSQLTDLEYFVPNPLGGQRKFFGGRSNVFRHEMREITFDLIHLGGQSKVLGSSCPSWLRPWSIPQFKSIQQLRQKAYNSCSLVEVTQVAFCSTRQVM